jgi:hypothetical protein
MTLKTEDGDEVPLSDDSVSLLKKAYATARLWNDPAVEPHHIVAAILATPHLAAARAVRVITKDGSDYISAIMEILHRRHC